MQVRVYTALIVLKSFSDLREKYKQLWHNDINATFEYTKILSEMSYYRRRIKYWRKKHNWKSAHYYRCLYAKQKRLFKKYRKAYKKDLLIAQLLLTDIKFSAIIAVHYLILNYEEARDRNMWNPWLKAISRYNGGWYNKRYIRRVIRNMNIVRKYKKFLEN